MAESLAAEFLGPVDAGEARVELRLLIAAAEREVLLDAQPLARRLAEGRHHRFAPGRGPGTPGFEIAHAASPARRSTRTSSQNTRLPCSPTRLGARRLGRWRAIT